MPILESLQKASSLHDLSRLLGYKPRRLSYIVYRIPQSSKYTRFDIPKSTGGVRTINAPVDRLKTLQRRLANLLYASRDEIEAKTTLRSLSHGFRRHHSIVTNARRHKRRRYVLNVDLQDFFPTFNFGRVRGFFIKNKAFHLDESVATLIAQIACHENALPQGSPCSPIISDLIAHILDVRLAQLSKRYQITYSRYADDLTFSTNNKEFPANIASQSHAGSFEWILGQELIDVINGAGFAINAAKTRMQYRMSRQVVTGLTVNAKVNIRSGYYRMARAMCATLFRDGSYHRPAGTVATKAAGAGAPPPEKISALGPIEGILSHIHYVKDLADSRTELEKKMTPTAARKLYANVLAYRYFVKLDQPLIICEGKTDNIYLKCAISRLSAFQPVLGEWSGKTFKTTVSFFSYDNQAHSLLGISGGSSDLKFFVSRYRTMLRKFGHKPLKHPVIVVIDNDQGSKEVFSAVKETFKMTINKKSTSDFYHLTDNLYLVKTPEHGSDGTSLIEDFFDPALLKTEINGKKFNPTNAHTSDGEYGKAIFAEKVVLSNAAGIDFSKFTPLLNRIAAVLKHYEPPKAASA